MQKQLFYRLFPILIIINGVLSINQWSIMPIGNTFIDWAISLCIIVITIFYTKHFFKPTNTSDYKVVYIYFVWLAITVFRGLFVPENYWEWKQLVSGSITLMLPILVFAFANPVIVCKVLRMWLQVGLPLFFIFIVWVIVPDAYHFYLSPILLLACFLPIIPFKWRIGLIALLLAMMFLDFGARSQVIKASMALMMSLAFLFAKHLTPRLLKYAQAIFVIAPLVILSLSFMGLFNPFEALSKNEGKYVEKKTIAGEKVEEDIAADTRTFIYVEVMESAIKNNYWLWGRTPARGNDSQSFGAYNAEDLKTGKYERHANELCFPNVFTWLGLIGVVVYALIYLRSSYLAVYRSNNIYIRVLGVYIAFRFAYGWIEDFNRFDNMNIMLWMMIAMGLSEQFRKMDNRTFKYWVRSIFK